MTTDTGEPAWQSPEPLLLASRCMRARTNSRCALDGCPITVGVRIGQLPDGRWAKVTCVIAAQHPPQPERTGP
jgi:hypothetical protein